MTKFGFTLSNRGLVTGDSSLADMFDLARLVDADVRWDSIWVGDSITAKPRLDALSLMSALGAVTERVRIGPGCFATTPIRPALLLAYQLAAIDVISNGRLTFAACQGAPENAEFADFKVPPRSRSGRMEEAIEIIRLVTSQDHASYHGRYNDFDDITIEPRSVQRPIPILVVSNARPDDPVNRRRGLSRAARLGDGWMTVTLTASHVAEYLDELRGYAAEEGRELSDDYEVHVYCTLNVNDDREIAFRDAKRYLDDYYMLDHSPAAVDRWCTYGPPDRCVAGIQEYIDAGATTITIRIAGSDQLPQYQRIVDEILPAFG